MVTNSIRDGHRARQVQSIPVLAGVVLAGTLRHVKTPVPNVAIPRRVDCQGDAASKRLGWPLGSPYLLVEKENEALLLRVGPDAGAGANLTGSATKSAGSPDWFRLRSSRGPGNQEAQRQS